MLQSFWSKSPRLRSATHCRRAIPVINQRRGYAENPGKPNVGDYNFGKVDEESHAWFDRLESRLDEVLKGVPKDYLHEQARIVSNRKQEALDFAFQTPLGPPSNSPDATSHNYKEPAPPLDLDDDLDWGKAMSYVSNDITEEYLTTDPRFQLAGRYSMLETLRVARHTQVTAGGRIYSFSALVLLGTGKGTAGLGYGRGGSVVQAIEAAKRTSEKSLISLELHMGSSIGKDIYSKYKKSKIFMRATRLGSGGTMGVEMKKVAEAFGIKDVTIWRKGSQNKLTLYRAIFQGLRDGVRTQEGVARKLGRKLFNKHKPFYRKGE